MDVYDLRIGSQRKVLSSVCDLADMETCTTIRAKAQDAILLMTSAVRRRKGEEEDERRERVRDRYTVSVQKEQNARCALGKQE